ncbi:leucine-rich repeat-containing protein 4 [Plakobranchus ocellatus]|uniref:Leucine-rich repeat-containing protein 4 n=1 Tax=Plakobranchus ocellatus TaxID=259542 RepID=A0AAV4CXQ3_9GAST|nr:leucine-rich repeat-containing protein 4 [Plakobranchus ocellatus]
MLLCVVLIYQTVSPAHSKIDVPCFSNCSCFTDNNHFLAIDCSARDFYSFPQDLPETTISVDLSSNQISTWNTYSVARLPHLSYIKLSNNIIKEVTSVTRTIAGDVRFNTDTKLRFFSDQDTTKRPSSSPALHGFSLKTLLLNDNQITSIENDAFAEYGNLELLDLSRNRLEILQQNVFRGLYSLMSLNLQQNHLDLLPETYPVTVFADLKRLQELNIQGNYRSDTRLFSPTLMLNNSLHLENTTEKFIDNRTYPDKALSYLKSLSVLQMDALHYHILPGAGFRYLTNLTVLDFNGSKALNGLPELFFSNFSFQKPLHLFLATCTLTFIHPNTFAYIPTLHSLSLYDNENLHFSGFEIASRGLLKTKVKILDISRIYVGPPITLQGKSFQNLKNLSLEELTIESNYLMFINVSVMGNIPRTLKTFSVGKNKLNEVDFLAGLMTLTHLEVFDASVQNKHSWIASKSSCRKQQSGPTPLDTLRQKRSPNMNIKRQTSSRALLSTRKSFSVSSLQKNCQELLEISEDVLRNLQREFCPEDDISHIKVSTLHGSKRMFNVSKAMFAAYNTGKRDIEF